MTESPPKYCKWCDRTMTDEENYRLEGICGECLPDDWGFHKNSRGFLGIHCDWCGQQIGIYEKSPTPDPFKLKMLKLCTACGQKHHDKIVKRYNQYQGRKPWKDVVRELKKEK